ncbi:MAG: transposase [Desulfosarcina sp.]|nr:transposase [Desulfobacterales bacterium]
MTEKSLFHIWISATERYGALVHVFCLMTNHYHILMETPSGNLSQIMQHINGAYTTYFNARHQRSGHLFQGRYKAILVDIDGYAKELSRYIHLNPVRAGMVDIPEQYPWSSYQYYIGMETSPGWLAINFILGCFGKNDSDSQKGYRIFVETLIGRKYKSPLKDAVNSTILGIIAFIEAIKNKYLSERKIDPDLPALKELSKKPSVDKITEEVESVFGEESVFREDRALARGVKIFLCHKYTGKMLKEIGRQFDIGASGVSQTRRRIAMKISQDNELHKKILEIENKLNLPPMLP